MGFLLGHGIAINNRSSLIYTLIWMAVAFVSVLVHELGHALVSQKLTNVTPSIRLWAMGGLADPRTHLTRKDKLKVVWAGPLAGLALFALVLLACCLVYGFGPGARLIALMIYPLESLINIEIISLIGTMSPNLFYLLEALVFVNFWWSMVNLLPVHPLDGGQIYACLEPSQSKVYQLGFIVGAVVAVIGLVVFQKIFLGVLFGFLAYQNYQSLQQSRGGYH